MNSIPKYCRFALLAVFVVTVPLVSIGRGDDSELIAAKYPRDAGIGQDPRVVFTDDFEKWETGSDHPPAKRRSHGHPPTRRA